MKRGVQKCFFILSFSRLTNTQVKILSVTSSKSTYPIAALKPVLLHSCVRCVHVHISRCIEKLLFFYVIKFR